MGIEPEEFLNPRNTVYKWDQCITEEDLREAICTLLTEHEAIPDRYFTEKQSIGIAIKTLDTMLDWVAQGKPDNFRMGRE